MHTAVLKEYKSTMKAYLPQHPIYLVGTATYGIDHIRNMFGCFPTYISAPIHCPPCSLTHVKNEFGGIWPHGLLCRIIDHGAMPVNYTRLTSLLFLFLPASSSS